MTPIIEFRNISFAYPPAGGLGEKVIFNDFSLKVDPGETLVIGGKSGCGKTTLLRLMAWMEEPGAGGVYFDGKPYAEFDPPALRRQVSLVSQIPVMMEGSTRRNLTLGLSEPVADEVLISWMDKFDLESALLESQADSLSVGQQQRVAVIRNLLVNPKALLLDEPTSGLDPDSGEIFRAAMRRLSNEDGLTIIWNSHDVSALESMATRTEIIDAGR